VARILYYTETWNIVNQTLYVEERRDHLVEILDLLKASHCAAGKRSELSSGEAWHPRDARPTALCRDRQGTEEGTATNMMTAIKKPVGVLVASLFIGISTLILNSCALKSTHLPPAMVTTFPLGASGSGGEKSWWICRFKISWPRNAEADGAVDLLLAHAVVGPVLREHSKEISWWRFHRRAVRDKTGHQFSFLFYSTSSVSFRIMEALRESKILHRAVEAGIVEKVIFDDPTKPTRPQIEATSDDHWSPALQRNWPSYIMGVSALWLGLIDDFMADVPAHNDDVSALLERYRQVDSKVTSLWRNEGQHAFLHHLSAVFGYEPLLIKKEIRF
jgi:hypothetical protein